MRNIFYNLPILFVLTTAAGAVTADERILVDLSQPGKMSVDAERVAPNLRFVFLKSRWRSPSVDKSDPFQGLHGDCVGAFEVRDDQSTTGGGYCTQTDSSGGHLVMKWEPEAAAKNGRQRGVWSVYLGDGKWKGASGGGAYEISAADEAGARIRRTTGVIFLP